MTLSAYTIEHMRPGALGFVLDSWLKSFADAPAAKLMRDYWRTQRRIAEAIVSDDRTRVYVARPSDRQRPCAWLCAQGDALHYAYVIAEHRRRGVCSELMDVAGGLVRYTHRRDPFTRFLDRRGLAYDAGVWR